MGAIEVKMRCNNCGWQGTVGDCNPGDDGQLLCPDCHSYRIYNVIEDKEDG